MNHKQLKSAIGSARYVYAWVVSTEGDGSYLRIYKADALAMLTDSSCEYIADKQRAPNGRFDLFIG